MTNKEFGKFCVDMTAKQVMYMWGDFGREITKKTISKKAGQYPEHYDATYQAELRSKIGKGWIGCDCTGLIKMGLWTNGNADAVPKYDAATDNSASGWYETAKVRGSIETMPERVGLILSYPGHCGVYVGNGEVIECTKSKFGNGVVKTKLSDRKWEKWCECAFIDYTPEVSENTIKTTTVRIYQGRPVYSTADFTQKIGTVFDNAKVQLIGIVGKAAAILYPTTTTLKIGFVEKDFIEEED